jgi:hypothetical protein
MHNDCLPLNTNQAKSPPKTSAEKQKKLRFRIQAYLPQGGILSSWTSPQFDRTLGATVRA